MKKNSLILRIIAMIMIQIALTPLLDWRAGLVSLGLFWLTYKFEK